jgi:indole-3-glycerol phosphate synthase
VRGTRRFSQAISEGGGISVVVDVRDAAGARAAESQGAEALVVSGDFDGVRDATELPILWRGSGGGEAAVGAGADACVIAAGGASDADAEELARLHGDAVALGLDCVVEVRDEEELQQALERIDPEIFLLAGTSEGGALELLPDVPAGRLAIADAVVPGREDVLELERAGVDAVIVGAGDVAALVGGAPPQV